MDESTDRSSLDDGRPRWRGINHLALVTPDMDATVRFYHGVLGMRVVASLSAGPMRHYFFEIGNQNTVAFFEWDGADVDTESVVKPAGIPPSFPTQFDHISFNLPDEQALIDLQDRLATYAVEVTPIVDHGFMRSVYFTDPNGIALEASWWVLDATGRPADFGDGELFADPDPVAAVRELQAAGGLVNEHQPKRLEEARTGSPVRREVDRPVPLAMERCDACPLTRDECPRRHREGELPVEAEPERVGLVHVGEEPRDVLAVDLIGPEDWKRRVLSVERVRARADEPAEAGAVIQQVTQGATSLGSVRPEEPRLQRVRRDEVPTA